MEEETTRKFTIATILILVVTLVSMDFNITGAAVKEPKNLEINRDGNIITVELKYNNNEYSNPTHTVYMEGINGIKTAFTECDRTKGDRGYIASGSGKCVREIATFDASGNDYSKSTRTFSVKNTGLKRTKFI